MQISLIFFVFLKLIWFIGFLFLVKIYSSIISVFLIYLHLSAFSEASIFLLSFVLCISIAYNWNKKEYRFSMAECNGLNELKFCDRFWYVVSLSQKYRTLVFWQTLYFSEVC